MDNIEKATAITNARIQFVSLVDKAANGRKFLFKKEKDGKAAFTTFGRIVKTDSENHYVTGIVYEPLTEDAHGDYMEAAEIQKAAYSFAKNGNKVDIQHSFEPFNGAVVVESWIAKADFKMGDEKICKDTWLMTVEISDADIWDKIEKGEISGFSMGGVGEYSEEDVVLNNIEKTDAEKKGLLAKLAKMLGLAETEEKTTIKVNKSDGNNNTIEKAGKKMSGRNKETLCGIYESLGAFLKEFDEPEEQENEGNAGKNKDKEEYNMTKQEVEQIVAAAIAKAMDSEAHQSQTAESNTASTEITPETVEKMVAAAIEKALAPQGQETQPVTAQQVQEMITAAVEKAVEPVLKSRGLPSNLNGSGSVEKSAGDEHYLHGIL